MSIESTIRRLAVRSPGFEVSGHGKGLLTPAEAGLLLAGVERQAAALMYAKYLGDYRDINYLKAWLHVQYAGEAVRWGWKIKNGSEALHLLAIIALADTLRGEPLTMRQKAGKFGCALSTWAETWEDRCTWGRRALCDQEGKAACMIARNSRRAA